MNGRLPEGDTLDNDLTTTLFQNGTGTSQQFHWLTHGSSEQSHWLTSHWLTSVLPGVNFSQVSHNIGIQHTTPTRHMYTFTFTENYSQNIFVVCIDDVHRFKVAVEYCCTNIQRVDSHCYARRSDAQISIYFTLD